jgi:tetratricopeptide (TPR) repeat protein
VLFVGAGSSRKVGYPMWGELLSDLETAARKVDEANVQKVDGVDFLLRANAYKQILGSDEYRRIICAAFSPRTPAHSVEHESLVAMPFRHVFTTNYDGVLQSAHRAFHGTAASSFDADEWDKLSDLWHRQVGSARSYVHLHGSIRRPKGIVLCAEEYDQRYHREKLFGDFLRGFLGGHRLVFVGFSLTDHDFKYILGEARATWQPSGPRHFAILPEPVNAEIERAEAADLRGLRGIEPVYFNNTSGDFSGLWKLIKELRADVDASKTKNGLVPAAAVQQLVTELLESDPDLLKAALPRLPGLVGKHSVTVSLSDTGVGSTTDIDREIDAVFKFVGRGLADEAIAAYEAIRTREGDRLTAKQQYRLDANIGTALYSKGEMLLASQAHLRAAGHFRDSRDAKGIELLGHFLSGNLTETRRLAVELCKSEPNYGRAWSIWVRTHIDRSDFGQVEAAVPVALRNDAEVALALSDLASRWGDLDAHVRYAQAAVAASPDWSDAHAMLGSALVSSERRFLIPNTDRGVMPEHAHLIVQAETATTRAIEIIGSADPGRRLGGLYYNRAVARGLLGQEAEAVRDLQEAFRRNPTEPAIALGFAMEAKSTTDMDRAVAALSDLSSRGEYVDQVQFAMTALRLRRRAQGDLDQARSATEQLCSRLNRVEPSVLRADIVRMALQVCDKQQRTGDGPKIVTDLPGDALPESQRLGLLARAHLQAGNRENAQQIAERALQGIVETTPWFDRREAARLAQDCGLFADAVRLWQTVIDPSGARSDTIHLVHAAYCAHEWRIVLNVCDAVRAAGRTTLRHLEVEVEVLVASREGARATSLLADWVSKHPNDKHAVLDLSVLAVRDGKTALAVFDESKLPTVSEVRHAGEGALLVFVLRRGPAPERALEVAYSLYRRFPEDPETHEALISCVFDPSSMPLIIERHQKVGDGAAACVRMGDEQPRWVYIEPGEDPAPSRNEFQSDHPLARAMWGRSKGDNFEYLGHSYEILDVDNRILRRVHEIMERYEENFPGREVLRRLSVPSSPSPNAPIEEQLGELHGVLQTQEHLRQMLESGYKERRLPITTFAKLSGRRVFDVVRHLASDHKLGVLADGGEPGRWTRALTWINQTTELVLDGTVLIGALILEHLDELHKLGYKLLVPQAVLDELRQLSLDAGTPQTPRGLIGLNQEKLFFWEPSPEEAAREVARIERVIQFVHSHCQVVGGASTLDLPNELKSKMDTFLDHTAIDAVSLAIKRNAPLWTDDLGLHHLLAEFGANIRTVWTQFVMRVALEHSRISEDTYVRLLARLLHRGYEFTRLSQSEMVAVLNISNWRTDRGPGEALIRVVCRVARMNHFNQIIVALFIKALWSACPRRDQAKKIIVSILEGIGRKQSQNNFAAFIYKKLSRLSLMAPNGQPLPNLFNDHEGRKLKRFLRSWRSRCGEFKPAGVRGRRSKK